MNMEVQPATDDALNKQHLEEFQRELTAMVNAMENKLPGLSQQLQKMNDLLRTYPETVALLTPEEIGQLTKGVIQESRVQFTLANVGGRKSAGTDLLKKLNAGSIDLGSIKF